MKLIKKYTPLIFTERNCFLSSTHIIYGFSTTISLLTNSLTSRREDVRRQTKEVQRLHLQQGR